MAYEVDCDICRGHAEGNNCKQVCIHCFNSQVKKIRRLMREMDKIRKKLTKGRNYKTNYWELFYPDGTSSISNYDPLLSSENKPKT